MAGNEHNKHYQTLTLDAKSKGAMKVAGRGKLLTTGFFAKMANEGHVLAV